MKDTGATNDYYSSISPQCNEAHQSPRPAARRQLACLRMSFGIVTLSNSAGGGGVRILRYFIDIRAAIFY
eukprot:scaffold10944_cov132-Skeletonema_menzelii.AAC.1